MVVQPFRGKIGRSATFYALSPNNLLLEAFQSWRSQRAVPSQEEGNRHHLTAGETWAKEKAKSFQEPEVAILGKVKRRPFTPELK